MCNPTASATAAALNATALPLIPRPAPLMSRVMHSGSQPLLWKHCDVQHFSHVQVYIKTAIEIQIRV